MVGHARHGPTACGRSDGRSAQCTAGHLIVLGGDLPQAFAFFAVGFTRPEVDAPRLEEELLPGGQDEVELSLSRGDGSAARDAPVILAAWAGPSRRPGQPGSATHST